MVTRDAACDGCALRGIIGKLYAGRMGRKSASVKRECLLVHPSTEADSHFCCMHILACT